MAARQVFVRLTLSRILLAAAVLFVAVSSAEARPVWRQVPTPLPPVIHTTKIRPPYLGPAWRTAPAVVSYTPAPEAEPTGQAPKAVAVAPPAAEPPAEKVVAAEPTPAPVKLAPVVAPAPAVQTPTPPKPTPAVVAQKAPDAPAAATPPPAPKPVAPPTAPAATAQPAVAEGAGLPWGQIVLGVLFTAAVAGAIFFLGRRGTAATS